MTFWFLFFMITCLKLKRYWIITMLFRANTRLSWYYQMWKSFRKSISKWICTKQTKTTTNVRNKYSINMHFNNIWLFRRYEISTWMWLSSHNDKIKKRDEKQKHWFENDKSIHVKNEMLCSNYVSSIIWQMSIVNDVNEKR